MTKEDVEKCGETTTLAKEGACKSCGCDCKTMAKTAAPVGPGNGDMAPHPVQKALPSMEGYQSLASQPHGVTGPATGSKPAAPAKVKLPSPGGLPSMSGYQSLASNPAATGGRPMSAPKKVSLPGAHLSKGPQPPKPPAPGAGG